MAVEAHHLLHTGGGQKLAAASHAGWQGGGGALCYDAPPATADNAAVYWRQSQLQGYQYNQQSSLAATPPASAPMMTVGQYGQVCASDSGVTFGGGAQQEVAPKKRKRADQPSQQFVPGLGAAGGVAAHLRQQLVDVDRLVLQHTAKMWAELAEQRKRHTRQVVTVVAAEAAKRLRAKEEEIERIGRLNSALEERVRSLFVESQVWRDLAHSNEAAANALRGELQQALDAQARSGVVAAAAADDDAASFCCGENDVVDAGAGEEAEVGTASSSSGSGIRRRCVVCGEGAAQVLLLPCRHLCACAPCADAARACPACGCAKNGSVSVKFS